MEHASMPDQRIIISTLEDVVEALDSCGEQRPHGMMDIEWSTSALWAEGNADVGVSKGE
jgi:uroporphyrin-III C-methyltransferase